MVDDERQTVTRWDIKGLDGVNVFEFEYGKRQEKAVELMSVFVDNKTSRADMDGDPISQVQVVIRE